MLARLLSANHVEPEGEAGPTTINHSTVAEKVETDSTAINKSTQNKSYEWVIVFSARECTSTR